MKTQILVLAVSATFAFGAPALAAGDSSGSDNATEQTSPKKLKCKKSEVIKVVSENGKKVKKCVKATTGILSDDELYEQGRLLAKEGEYEWAITVLSAITNQNDPRVLNYIGYSHRKAGRLETGIGFYHKALKLNPDYVLAREYLGEGYVAAGRLDMARAQLEEIAKRCGAGCEEYKSLKTAIETGITG